MDLQRKKEIQFYGISWILIFIAVTLSVILGSERGHFDVSVRNILGIWHAILPFFLLFVLHDLTAAAFLKKKRPLYIVLTVLLLGLFAGHCFYSRPTPQGGIPPGAGSPRIDPEMLKFIIGLLLIGINLSVKSYYEGLREKARLEELRVESLQAQLDSLRWQINPHFFMNTLNNIQALIYLNPDKASESIDEFSRLMRIILYENDKPAIPLGRELDFLRHYISLMRLRYPENVRIETSFPESDGGAEVPPLLFATFAENAFKHGISYEQASFVEVSVAVENGEIVFRCDNSRAPAEPSSAHGLGLENVRKRLALLYADRCILDVEERKDRYAVRLTLPSRLS
ncbi:MAG: histidine kinase [Bacteroidales bacterium]|nr:histidine kinase [Bacteroidales bacterium]